MKGVGATNAYPTRGRSSRVPHLLGRIRGPPLAAFKAALKEHAPAHAKDGLFLEHAWTNADDPSEVLFLFRAEDLTHARRTIDRTHAEARRQDPDANLPTFTFLQ